MSRHLGNTGSISSSSHFESSFVFGVSFTWVFWLIILKRVHTRAHTHFHSVTEEENILSCKCQKILAIKWFYPWKRNLLGFFPTTLSSVPLCCLTWYRPNSPGERTKRYTAPQAGVALLIFQLLLWAPVCGSIMKGQWLEEKQSSVLKKIKGMQKRPVGLVPEEGTKSCRRSLILKNCYKFCDLACLQEWSCRPLFREEQLGSEPLQSFWSCLQL